MAQLHALDVSTVTSVLAPASRGRLSVSALLGELAAMVALVDDPVVSLGHEWLIENQPESTEEVICHGDLHAYNVLVEADVVTAVLDWTNLRIAPRAFDVAYTGLVLSYPPLAAPALATPLIRLLGRRGRRRFEQSYLASSNASIGALDWYEALHAFRLITALVTSDDAKTPNAESDQHPWRLSAPGFARRFREVSGINLNAAIAAR